MCPQHDLVFESLNCRENVELVAAQKGIDVGTSAVDQMLTSVGLQEKIESGTGTLSGGQKRKLSLACALIGGPKFVLLDEPTAGMDPSSRRTVWGVMCVAGVEPVTT